VITNFINLDNSISTVFSLTILRAAIPVNEIAIIALFPIARVENPIAALFRDAEGLRDGTACLFGTDIFLLFEFTENTLRLGASRLDKGNQSSDE
jgi:hypothetical protein